MRNQTALVFGVSKFFGGVTPVARLRWAENATNCFGKPKRTVGVRELFEYNCSCILGRERSLEITCKVLRADTCCNFAKCSNLQLTSILDQKAASESQSTTNKWKGFLSDFNKIFGAWTACHSSSNLDCPKLLD
eukprot:3107583-Amphidinium_carterae.1